MTAENEAPATDEQLHNDEPVLCPREIHELDTMFMARIALRKQLTGQAAAMNLRLSLIPLLAGTQFPSREDRLVLTMGELSSFFHMTRTLAKAALSMGGAPYEQLYPVEYDKAIETLRDYIEDETNVDALERAIELGRPLSMWGAFKAAHNRGRQRATANQQMADRLSSLLCPQAYAELNVTKDCVEFPLAFRAERPAQGVYVMSRKDAATLVRIGQALNQFIAETTPRGFEHSEYGDKLIAVGESYMKDRPVISRERIYLGSGLDLVAGRNRFTLLIPMPITQMLARFVTQYASSVLGRAA